MKSIKSGFAKRNAQMIMEKLGQCDGIIKTCISICPDSRLSKVLEELQENIVDAASKAEMLSNGDEQIQSSMQGQERGIQAIMDEYGCTREEAIEIMNGEVTSGCHGKAKKDEKKPVKSSVDTSDGSFFCAQVPDSAFLQAGYLQFEGNDAWMVFQKRDKEGNIISEKEITENDLAPLNSLQSSAIKSYIDHDIEEENNRYDDEELRELPPDADDDDYDYGDWESGRPMYSSVDRNRMNVKALYK